MVKGKWFPQGSDVSVPLGLREKVFAKGRDGVDALAQQVVVYDGDLPVGAARLWWAEGAFHLDQVGVLEECRGKGFGDLLLRLLLFKASSHFAARVEVSAPQELTAFFERYGFAPQGDVEGDGPVTMSLEGKDISLSHCQRGCGPCQETP